MRVKILASFPYAENGRDTVLLHPSDDPEHRVEIRDELCAGLAAEGFIDGREHDLPLLSEGRRNTIIDNILAAGRAELSRLPDEELIRIGEHYQRRAQEAEEAPEEEAEDAEFLLGSSVLPAVVEIGDLRVQLGGLVVAAARMSGHSTETWNAMSESDREDHLAKALEVLRSDPAVAATEIDPFTILPPVESETSDDDKAPGPDEPQPEPEGGATEPEPGTAQEQPAGPEQADAPEAEVDAAPKHKLTPAQEAALDRIPDDGKTKAGGAPKGGNRKKSAA